MTPFASGDVLPRFVLERVPRVGFYNGESAPEDAPLPSVVRACLEFLGDDGGVPGLGVEGSNWRWRACGLMMGVSQLAFRFQWNFAVDPAIAEWLQVDCNWIETLRRCFHTVGYAVEVIVRADLATGLDWIGPTAETEADFLAWIDRGLRERGCPVIGIGVIGPPEPCLITGYEDAGRTLVGWNYFTDEHAGDPTIGKEPDGRFRRSDWLSSTRGLVLVGQRETPPPRGDVVYPEALTEALTSLRTAEVEGVAVGLASHDQWLAALLDDEAFAAYDDEALARCHQTLRHGGGDLAERRAYASTFLHQAADLTHGLAAEALHEAAGCCDVIHDLVWRLWQAGGAWPARPDAEAMFARPELRRRLASVVGQVRVQDALFIGHLERALLALGIPREELAEPLPAESGPEVAAAARFFRWGPGHPEEAQVPVLQGWQERVCSFAAALSAACAPTEFPYDYTDIMGYAGLAFRTRWFRNPSRAQTAWGDERWHPVSPHGEQPEEIAAVAWATGWRLRAAEIAGEARAETLERLTTDIVLSVSAGRPVVVGYRTDLGVVYDYHIHSMNLRLRHQQACDSEHLTVHYLDEGLHSPYLFLLAHGEPPAPREAFVGGLAVAVRNARRAPVGPFHFGLDALAGWADDLDAFEGCGGDERSQLFLANWWSLLHLADARHAAVAYLEAHRAELGVPAQAQLDRALALYREEAAALRAYLDAHCGFVAWWGGTQGVADWQESERREQADLLRLASRIESRAHLALEAILALEAWREP
jgi:hypothetical protein